MTQRACEFTRGRELPSGAGGGRAAGLRTRTLTLPRCRAGALPERLLLPGAPAESTSQRQPRPFAGRSPQAHPPPQTAARTAPAGGGSSGGKSRGWAGSGPRRRDPTPFPSRAAPRAALPVPTLFMCGRNWDFPSACSAGRDLHAGLTVSCRPERGVTAGAAGAVAASVVEEAGWSSHRLPV